jgi:2-amino-4-hydroxy-6-hydroxymethyldihydropteridine diphosphokinase
VRQARLVERAFLLLGSNLEPEIHLPKAARELARFGRIGKVSRVYQSRPVARPGQPDFLNGGVLLETNLDLFFLSDHLRSLEAELGRVRGADKHAARTIDIDICLFGARIDAEPVVIPAAELVEHAHVAVPIAELDPGFPHPITGETLGSIAARLARNAQLRRRDDVSLKADPDA